MKYTQDQLAEIWKLRESGNEPIDDPIDPHGSLAVLILKNEHKIQSMMVNADYSITTYSDHDSAPTVRLPTIIYSRSRTQEDAWADWCVEEEIA